MKWRMKKMFKKIGLTAIALLGTLAMAPHQAKAAVRFGVDVAPAYSAPVYSRRERVVVAPDRVVVGRHFDRREYRWDRDRDRREIRRDLRYRR